MKTQLKNKKVLIALISVCIVLAAVLSVFVYYKTGLKAVASREAVTAFSVQPGETSEAVLDKLQKQELIRNKTAAKLYKMCIRDRIVFFLAVIFLLTFIRRSILAMPTHSNTPCSI